VVYIDSSHRSTAVLYIWLWFT